MDRLEEKLEKLEEKVTSLSNTAKVIAVLAVIFGVSGAFGYSLIKSVEQKISKLSESEQYFTELRKKEEKALTAYTAAKKEELDVYVEKISDDLRTIPSGAILLLSTKSSCPENTSEMAIAAIQVSRGQDDPDLYKKVRL